MQNDGWICKDIEEIPVLKRTRFLSSVMVLGVISNQGHIMSPFVFPKGLRVTAEIYQDVLRSVVKPWMDKIADGRPYVFQQDSAPAHKSKTTQTWLMNNVPTTGRRTCARPPHPTAAPSTIAAAA